MTPVLFGLSMAMGKPTAPFAKSACALELEVPTTLVTKRAPTLASHLAALGWNVDRFRFAVIAVGTRPRSSEVVDRFTAALTRGHFPLVIDPGDERAEARQWRAGLILPRAYVEWIGLVARALEYRLARATGPAEIEEFGGARSALYRQFEIVLEVAARLAESAEYDEPEEFFAATSAAWPVLARHDSERALAFAALPPGEIRRALRARVLDLDDVPATPVERARVAAFHRELLANRAALRRIPR